MNARRPYDRDRRFDAHTEWKLKWHFHYKSQAESCALTDSIVTADIFYVLPHWADEAQADGGLQAQWENYIQNLRTHESGHAGNGEKAANEIATMLNNLASFPSCDLLEKAANDRAYQILDEHKAWDLQYDQDTRHGATQGAVFP
jgi:predicted secreted Zn-dependent protease